MADYKPRTLADPAQYPSKMSYKPLMELYKQRMEKKKSISEVTSCSTQLNTLASSFSPEPGDDWKKFGLKDGGRLTIIQRGDAETYYQLKTSDGRRLLLERTPTSMMLLSLDARGRAVHTLACEL